MSLRCLKRFEIQWTDRRVSNCHEALLMIYRSSRWSIDLKRGWTRVQPLSEQPEIEVSAFSPNSSSALFTISTFDPSVSGVSAKTWVELVARINRQKKRTVEPTRIGEFSGFYISFDTDSVCIRAWAIRFANDPLDVTYRCDSSMAGRYNADVDKMLSSIRRRTNDR